MIPQPPAVTPAAPSDADLSRMSVRDKWRELSGDVSDVLSGGLPFDTLTYRGSMIHDLYETGSAVIAELERRCTPPPAPAGSVCLHGRPLTDPVCPECAAMYPDPAGSGDADAIRLADELEYYFHGMLTPDGANGRLAAATIRRLAARVESLERELAGRTVPGDVLAAAETVVSVPSTMNAWGAEPGRLIPCAYRMARFILSLNAPPGGPTGQRDPAVAYAEATIRNLQGG